MLLSRLIVLQKESDMAIEHEDKYLLTGKPVFNDDLQLRNIHHIEQFYMSLDRDRKYVSRARCEYVIESMKFYKECHKVGSGPTTEEIEYNITDTIYNQLKQHCSIGNIVTKTRHVAVDRAGLIWEIDEYPDGHWIAELENPPMFYLLDCFPGAINVTDDFNYKNISISLNGFPKT